MAEQKGEKKLKRNVLFAIGIFILLLVIATIAYWLSPKGINKRASSLLNQAEKALSQNQLIDAEIYLRKALKLKPDDPEINLKLAQTLEKEGILDQARDIYLSLAQTKPDPEMKFNAGILSLKLNQTDQALQIFLENNQAYPDHIPTLYQLGAIFARKVKCASAIIYFEKIIELNPNEPEAYNNLGYCYYTLDQLKKAKLMFEKAIELKPEFTSAIKSLETIEQDLKSQK